MGDIAEMLLDGTMCEGCGEFIYDESDEFMDDEYAEGDEDDDFTDYEGEGIPRYCSKTCEENRGF